MSPGEGFACATEAEQNEARNDSHSGRVMRSDSLGSTSGCTPRPALLAQVQAEITEFSIEKKERAHGFNISGDDRTADRLMRARCAALIGENCSPLASDDVLLSLAGSDGSSVEHTPAKQAEFERGLAVGAAAIELEHGSHEVQARLNADLFNSSFDGRHGLARRK